MQLRPVKKPILITSSYSDSLARLKKSVTSVFFETTFIARLELSPQHLRIY